MTCAGETIAVATQNKGIAQALFQPLRFIIEIAPVERLAKEARTFAGRRVAKIISSGHSSRKSILWFLSAGTDGCVGLTVSC
jgi:hypothetical protein